MSVMAKLKSVPQHLPHGTAPRGIVGVVVDKGERFGAALAFGFVKGKYRSQAVWKGYGADLWIGVGATLAAVGFNAFSGGRSGVASHLERIGDAGISSYLNSIGAALGNRQAGRTIMVVEAGKQNPALAARTGVQGTVLGEIPRSVGGVYLDKKEISDFLNAK